MTDADMTPNRPDVVAEVSALFERYEQALVERNVDILDATFWDSPHTIRYAVRENGYGFAAIHAHRLAAPPAGSGGHQGKAAAAGDPHAGARLRHREPGVQAARPGADRPPEPGLGPLSRDRLEGGVRPRVHHAGGHAAVLNAARELRIALAPDAPEIKDTALRWTRA